jgi:multicomponent Na+:H+ antiporter subunit F
MADFIFTVATVLMLAGILLALVRFSLGPTIVDRVLAFDSMTIISLSLIGVIAHLAGRAIYLDVGLVYGLLNFLGVIAVARYLENGL